MAKHIEDEVVYYYDFHLRLTGLEAEAQARQAEARQANALAEKLRSLGIDPDRI